VLKPSITMADRVTKLLIKGVCALPLLVQRFIGGPPIVVDGQTLHISTQMVLRLLGWFGGRTFESKPLALARLEVQQQAWTFGSFTPVDEIRDFSIEGPHGPIPMRLYRPNSVAPNGALMLFFHGGGWVLGGLDTCDSLCRMLAVDANITIVSVDYRLAPEHRFPIGLEDSLAAFDYLYWHAEDFGCSPDLVGVAGESAGGTMAIVISQLAAQRARETEITRKTESGVEVKRGDRAGRSPIPAFQIPLMPVTDLSQKQQSYRLFGKGFMLTEAQMDWYKSQYLNTPDEALDTRVSPLLAENLQGLPPAIIVVAGFDPLRDEALLYSRKLEDANVETEVILFAAHTHAEINATGAGGTAREMLRKTTHKIRNLITRIEGVI
jgi:acetyl esterase